MDGPDANAQGGCLAEDETGESLLFLGPADEREDDAGAALLHLHGREPGVGSAFGEELLPGEGEHLSTHIVNIRLYQQHGSGVLHRFAQPEAEDVGPVCRVPRAGSVAGPLEVHPGPLEASKRGQERGARGRRQLTGRAPGADGCPRAGEELERRGGRDGQHAVGAGRLAAPEGKGRRVELLHAEQPQPGDHAHDVDDCVHRAHVVQVHRVN